MNKTMTVATDAIELLPGLLPRPPQSLHSLPVEFRWEVTRRHPYYLIFWKSAEDLHAGVAADELSWRLSAAAVAILQVIGVTGNPPPPTSGPEALGTGQLAKAWLDGAIAPLTYRTAVGLLSELPRETRMALGSTLLWSCYKSDASPAGENDEDRRRELVHELITMDDPALDRIPSRPFVGLNLFQPRKAIADAVGKLVREHKRASKLPERRRRPEKLEPYLRVWDLREGWIEQEARYDPARERSFADIAKIVRCPLATVANRYRSAFELVSGHRYTFTAWTQLFTVLKLFGEHGVQCTRRRHLDRRARRAGSLREVAEATLAGGGDPDRHGGSLLASLAAHADASDFQIFHDIRTLIDKGLDDEAIVDRMEFEDPERMLKVVGCLRQRVLDESTASPKRIGPPTSSPRHRR